MEFNENELIQKISEDDSIAFEALYNHYRMDIYRFIYKFIKAPELSDDLCQEIFIRIWENRHSLVVIKSFKPYLYTITKNHTLNFLKRASVDSKAMGIIYSSISEKRNEMEDNLITNEYLNYLRNILNTLPPQSREVFKLCRQQGHSYDEVAKLLGISRSCVKKHMVRSMRTLKLSVVKEFGISLSLFFILIKF
ncbi:RNA polymerase sigma-70 factor, ECF subfamily [Mucilaginibacter mallensis]|uniref:RNA polymerase sigma-70 factor, ECF subfamily n=1 Tax=Mucilaginibacter mallensis TaxID=652787 RepID=A0A1H1ZNK2_MUCMA|nr:RNA polymerase sigma-70 factor [Mucilaginibacter mallensis]SDT35250.1 RNA polymerase sigma-70 factor, ECF subfamily [Mucilaginibacter mallensis]